MNRRREFRKTYFTISAGEGAGVSSGLHSTRTFHPKSGNVHYAIARSIPPLFLFLPWNGDEKDPSKHISYQEELKNTSPVIPERHLRGDLSNGYTHPSPPGLFPPPAIFHHHALRRPRVPRSVLRLVPGRCRYAKRTAPC